MCLYCNTFCSRIDFINEQNSDMLNTYKGIQGRIQGRGNGVEPPLEDLGGCIPPPQLNTPLATNQTKIPYPKPLKHSNLTNLRLNEIKNNSLDNFDMC